MRIKRTTETDCVVYFNDGNIHTGHEKQVIDWIKQYCNTVYKYSKVSVIRIRDWIKNARLNELIELDINQARKFIQTPEVYAPGRCSPYND